MDFEKYKAAIIDTTLETQEIEYEHYAIACCLTIPPKEVAACISQSSKSSVIKIPNFCLNPCRFVNKNRSVTSPVIKIGEGAFAGQEKITDIIIQNMVYKIGKEAFADCINLKRITIPKHVKFIDRDTFRKCDSLEDVYYEGTEDEWKNVKIIHDASRVINTSQRGLYCDIEHYIIPGNEALFRAKIHYNCIIN